jgi:hypothetical protein
MDQKWSISLCEESREGSLLRMRSRVIREMNACLQYSVVNMRKASADSKSKTADEKKTEVVSAQYCLLVVIGLSTSRGYCLVPR